ncbi:MAG: hypothetical protein LUG25_06155 [Oscillospiraceae bacterium]|nr:hypothetical protein [Oscillospiraceae bacterium]
MNAKTNMLRRLLTLALTLSLICALAAPALADGTEDDVPALADGADGTEDDASALTDGANETKDNVFPVTFDLRDGETNGFGESLVTSVKDQCAWRTCWGFGVISAAESSIIAESDYWTAENLDL